jgi:anti-sigma regulatory factor (Ser/Thr protein kinase)/anti-anti-sigma regulatory factor
VAVSDQERQRSGPLNAAAGCGSARDAPQQTASLLAAHLPAGLPVLPRARIAACYRAAGAGQPGGGWFDAVPLAEGDIALAVGAVAGSGIPAVAGMGQLRAVLSEVLAAEHDLAAAVARADRFAAAAPGLRGSTLVLAVLSPASGTLQYVTCGQPAPVIAGADGRSRCLPPTHAGPLGTGATRPPGSARLQPGDLLLLSSGALASGPTQTLDESMAQLAEAAAAARAGRFAGRGGVATGADRVARHTAGLLGSQPAQPGEVVTLAAEWLAAPVAGLDLELPASLPSLRTARHTFAGWLSQLDPLTQDQDTLQLAVGEIVGNAIEHAYPPGQPGVVRLQAVLGADGQLECRIGDRGSWQVPDPAVPGRGSGLMLVGRMIDQMDVHHPPQPPGAPRGARGTVVTLRHRLRRAAAVTSSPALAARPNGAPFEVDSGVDGPVVWATVRGPVDQDTAGSLRSQLLIACRGGTLPLRVDLSAVSQLGGAGIAALYEVSQQLAVYQQELSLAAAPASVAAAALGLAGLPYRAA